MKRGSRPKMSLHFTLLLLIVSSFVYFAVIYNFLTQNAVMFGLNRVFDLATSKNSFSNTHKDCGFKVRAWTKNICPQTMADVENFLRYPNLPDVTYCERNLRFVLHNRKKEPIIKQIFLSFPNLRRGFYQFRVMSSIPFKMKRRRSMQEQATSSAAQDLEFSTNRTVFLMENSVVEIFAYCPPGDNILDIDWSTPGSVGFVPIRPCEVECGELSIYRDPKRDLVPPDKNLLVGFIPQLHVQKAFPVCNQRYNKSCFSHASHQVSVHTSDTSIDAFLQKVLQRVMGSLQEAAPSKYPAYQIKKIEVSGNASEERENRVFLDLIFTVDGLDYSERLGEYLQGYQSEDNQFQLCRPLGYEWGRSTSLNFVYASACGENETFWGLHFIENIAEIVQRSLDVSFNVVMTACDESQRRRYEERLREWSIVRGSVVLFSSYEWSKAMRHTLRLVEDDGIMVFCEPRLKIPAGIGEEIRQHTFRSMMAFSPIAFQLDCGYFPEDNRASLHGEWCPQCGALTAMFKMDWKRVLYTDFDTNKVQDSQNLRHVIVNKEIEVFRVRLQELYILP